MIVTVLVRVAASPCYNCPEQDDPEISTMAWATLTHSPSEINQAGEVLVGNTHATEEQLHDAVDIITHWRQAHGFPLNTFQVSLRSRSSRIAKGVSVAQRSKRLPAIEAKLRRFSTMRLSQMQDIAGCRSVLQTVEHSRALVEIYKKAGRGFKHDLMREKNYVDEPKEDGYRSHHLVYAYRSDAPNQRCWNGIPIEVQIRSRMQHSWATAVEAVDMFTGQALKSSVGREAWRNFFILMGEFIARRERTQLLLPLSDKQLKDELRAAEQDLNVIHLLGTWTVAVRFMRTPKNVRTHFYVLDLDAKGKETRVYRFGRKEKEAQLAFEFYEKQERESRESSDRYVVLVHAGSQSAVKTAYKGFFSDTARFLELVRTATR